MVADFAVGTRRRLEIASLDPRPEAVLRPLLKHLLAGEKLPRRVEYGTFLAIGKSRFTLCDPSERVGLFSKREIIELNDLRSLALDNALDSTVYLRLRHVWP